MAKSKLRVRRLPPSSILVAEDRSFQEDVEQAESPLLLVKEWQARVSDISILAGEGTRPRPHHTYLVLKRNGDPSFGPLMAMMIRRWHRTQTIIQRQR
jgi:hypothetical protein